MNMHAIEYTLPQVTLLQETGIGVAEVAARTCYDSFKASENECVKSFDKDSPSSEINGIEHSELLDTLAWTHHHHSILEHAVLSFFIKGTSRGVLQEHARHRIQAISVRSTRYVMSGLLNAFAAIHSDSALSEDSKRDFFYKEILALDMFVIADEEYLRIEIDTVYNKLAWQMKGLNKEGDYSSMLSKDAQKVMVERKKYSVSETLAFLNRAKNKSNAGDAFKHIVSDNWKVDMVVSFNIRSLKNYFDLRDSGAAFFQMQWLAKEMKKQTPLKYLSLISKKDRVGR